MANTMNERTPQPVARPSDLPARDTWVAPTVETLPITRTATNIGTGGDGGGSSGSTLS